MDWLHSSINKDLYPNFEPSLFKSNNSSVNDDNASQFLISQLRQGYQERIQSLENQVKEIYRDIDEDQILKTMALSQVSKEFRRQRIQEIAEDSMLAEKEVQIEKLIQINACLKKELFNADIEIKELKRNVYKDFAGSESRVNELLNELRSETALKGEIQDENNVLQAKLKHLKQEYEKVASQKESRTNTNEHVYRESIERLNYEVDKLQKENKNLDQKNLTRELSEGELKRELDNLRDRYIQLEGSHNQLKNENNSLRRALHDYHQQSSETNTTSDMELNNVKHALRIAEDELKASKEKLKLALKDNTDLLSKSEYISTQARKVIEQEHMAFNEKVDEVKNKYKPKIEKYKSRIGEFETLNQSLTAEVQSLRNSLEDTKKQQSRAESQLSEEVKQIRGRSERKERDLEASHQKLVVVQLLPISLT